MLHKRSFLIPIENRENKPSSVPDQHPRRVLCWRLSASPIRAAMPSILPAVPPPAVQPWNCPGAPRTRSTGSIFPSAASAGGCPPPRSARPCRQICPLCCLQPSSRRIAPALPGRAPRGLFCRLRHLLEAVRLLDPRRPWAKFSFFMKISFGEGKAATPRLTFFKQHPATPGGLCLPPPNFFFLPSSPPVGENIGGAFITLWS